MDPIVEAALRKWPNVPHCWDWLALDARGTWYMRDDRVQAAGPFPQIKGSAIRHDKLLAFIGRNYASDAQGAWYFQNGPQRVYVTLEAAPWVWRVGDAGVLATHTGIADETRAPPRATWLDEHGRLFVDHALGFGIVHTLDMLQAADAIDHGRWPHPRDARFETLPQRFGYVVHPQPQP